MCPVTNELELPTAHGNGFSAADSTSIDRQRNPFAYDPFHALGGFVALGLKWDLGYFKNRAEVKRARAEYDKLLAKQEFAETGIPLQVKKSYLELKQAQANITTYRKGLKLARGLLALESTNFAFGLREARDLIDALVSYAVSQKSFFESMYNYNLAASGLSQPVGK